MLHILFLCTVSLIILDNSQLDMQPFRYKLECIFFLENLLHIVVALGVLPIVKIASVVDETSYSLKGI